MKKLLSVIISLTLLTLFFTQFVFAENDGVVETKNILSNSILTKKMSKDIALNHMINFTGDNSVKIKDVENMYDLEDNVTAYCITFQKTFDKETIPSGYVIVSKLEKL